MENDSLMFSKDPEIMNAINSEKILYSNKIQKMKSFFLKTERNLIITESAIYTFHNKKLKKTVKYNDISAITFSSKSNEFIIHRKNQYDFHYLCTDKIKLICTIIKEYEKIMQKPIILCETKEKSLKSYVTSKKEKKKDANMSRMDKNKIIDTQTFLFDHDQNKILTRAQISITNNSNNILNLNIDNEDNNDVVEENIVKMIFYKDGNDEITENDLKYIDIIGRGKLGKIYLVQNLLNKEYYAVKFIDKNDKEESTMEKIEIVKNLNSTFLINIKLCFEINNRIYFCFEFIQNEDLFYHINYKTNFENINEEKIRFFSASIILALEYLHKNGITYRNITPKNILITKDGYIKLTPFSLEELFNIPKNIETNISKNEYNSPESYTSKPNISSDFWNLGIIIYEMIYGIPPFYSLDNNTLSEMITKNEIRFPENITVSKNLKDLMEKLLKKNLEERLGKNGDINEIKNHDFFKEFNFDDLLNQKIESPFKPNFSDNLRNNNFNESYNYEDLIKVELMNIN